MDQIKNRDINLMTIYLIFHQHLNFLATHVDARSWNADFSTIFGRKQPMRGDLANSILKAKIEIKQIGVFKKSFFLNMVVFGLGLFVFWSWLRIWTRKFEFPKFLIFFFLTTQCITRVHACRGGERAWNFTIFGLKKLFKY